ncbi:hypothetical protein FBB35_18865 [Nostoc sp. TCL240-02]|nr:hypothetical protein FBB35_18865 [Nostoc sp. TCL240-02]
MSNLNLILQQFQIQILTTGTVYIEDKRVSLQGHQDGADDTEFWGNVRIFSKSDTYGELR